MIKKWQENDFKKWQKLDVFDKFTFPCGSLTDIFCHVLSFFCYVSWVSFIFSWFYCVFVTFQWFSLGFFNFLLVFFIFHLFSLISSFFHLFSLFLFNLVIGFPNCLTVKLSSFVFYFCQMYSLLFQWISSIV